jgi:large subunit ribosomal protein L2
MAVKKLNPVTPGTRFRVAPAFDEITASKPEKSLLAPLKKSGGRNNEGKMTARYIGGGHKRRLRIVDFQRSKFALSTIQTVQPVLPYCIMQTVLKPTLSLRKVCKWDKQ